jgi:sulfur carrier protein
MTIRLNGDVFSMTGNGVPIRGVLIARGWSFPLIVTTLNGTRVPREAWDRTLVHDGDELDAMHLLSGG